MKLLKTVLLLIVFFSAADCYAGIVFPLSKITIKAVDDSGVPIENASVTASYDYPKGFGMGWGTTTKFVDGKTDNEGLFSVTKSSAEKCNFRVSKDGYYDTSKSYTFKERTLLFTWSPWNPIMEIKLKKIKNPTKMYAKSINNLNATKVPALDIPIGYDLEKGDWVSPHGKGERSDFIFVCKARNIKNDDWDASYKLTFSNEHDGIQEYIEPKDDYGAYRWPYEAPEDGYKNEINWSSFHHPGGWAGVSKSDYKENRKYIFRVRTKTDENGNIVETRYGKIVGDIQFFSTGEITFTYFFNHSGTRSLEYDSKNPLFKWSKKEWQYEVKGP